MSEFQKRVESAVQRQLNKQEHEKEQRRLMEERKKQESERARLARQQEKERRTIEKKNRKLQVVRDLNILKMLEETALGLGLFPQNIEEHVIYAAERVLRKRPRVKIEGVDGEYIESIRVPFNDDDIGYRTLRTTYELLGHALILSGKIDDETIRVHAVFAGISEDQSKENLIVGSRLVERETIWECRDSALASVSNPNNCTSIPVPDPNDPKSMNEARSFLEDSLLAVSTNLATRGRRFW